MRRSNTIFGFGAIGIIIGALCVTFIYVAVEYGPDSHTTSGSSIIYLERSVVAEISRPFLPKITRVAFFTCFVSFLFGITSIVRKENKAVSLVALSFGFAPVLLYILGTTLVFGFYVGLMLLLAATRKRVR